MILKLPTRALVLVVLGSAAVLLVLLLVRDDTPSGMRSELATSSGAPVAPSGPEAVPAPAPNPPPSVGDALQDLFAPDDPAWAWSRVDLEALRDELPDNAFWTLAAPTDDPNVREERRRARDAQNREWGRILSNTAPEAEIRSFYADRQRESSDLVTFTTRLLDEYGSVLPDRDRGLVELSRRMHRQRLEELPSRLQEALDRRAAHVDAVTAWKADQAAFGVADTPGGVAD